MPNFTARIVGGDEVPWFDLPSSTLPSRLNLDPDHHPSFRLFEVVATPVSIEVRATVNGIDGPLDAALGGNLFTAAWAEWSGSTPPAISYAAGQTSVVSFTVGFDHVGHFCLRLRRKNGGAVLLHFDVLLF